MSTAVANDLSTTSGTSPPPIGYGATQSEWRTFARLVSEDLLPVVSNPNATISPQSKLRQLGKVPSRYNSHGHAAGIAQWTQKITTKSEIEAWSKQPDYGICVQARKIRALDCDIENTVLARDVHDEIDRFLAIKLPTRSRSNTSKFLLPFIMPGDYAKRIIRCDHGQIEFLGSGQQWIAAGTHPSGARYAWPGGLPDSIPTLTPEQFEKLWARLVECFAAEGTESITEATPSGVSRAAKLADAVQNDPVARVLVDKGACVDRDGKLRLPCPFADGHTPGGDDTVVYLPRYTGGYKHGHFNCFHASCAGRKDGAFLDALGIIIGADDFDVLPTAGDKRTRFLTSAEFAKAKPSAWIVKNVLPQTELGVIYGESGSGKSFFALDLLGAIARGVDWRGHKTLQGLRCGYVAAEGAAGFRKRLVAYSMHHKVSLEKLEIAILPVAPNFMDVRDIIGLGNAMLEFGKIDVLMVDTLAQVTAGANENSGEDMGRAIGHCKMLHKMTGALVILIHHSGKDCCR